jgi:biotin operon repressor
MPRYRGTKAGAATLVGRLLLLVAAGKETSASLAAKLGVSDRQVNRYILQLMQAGWQIERRGVPTHQDYYIELTAPQILLPEEKKQSSGKRRV